MLPLGFTEEGRRLAVRAGGRGAFDEVLPILIRGTSWSQIPAEHLGDALLSIHRDWDAFKPATIAVLFIRLERLNAEIMEQHRQMIEGPAPRTARPTPMPTRKGKRKGRSRTGRR